MKTVLPLKSKGGAEQGQGGGAVQDRLGEEGGRPSRAETEFGGWRERGGLKTRLLIPQEVCKRHARVTPDPSQHTQRRLHTHTSTQAYTPTATRTHTSSTG